MSKRIGVAISAVALVVVAVVVTIILTTGGGSSPTPPATVGSTTTPTASASASAADPYAVYLANNPDPKLILSREDAQTRALLGCGQTWAPGTVDAVLAQAYAALCPK